MRRFDQDRYRGSEDEDPQDLGEFVDNVVEDAKGWFAAQKEYTLLTVTERIGKLGGSLVILILLAMCISGALLMSVAALGIYLGEILGNWPLGLLYAAGIFLLMGVAIYFVGKRPIRDMITLHIINASRDDKD